MGLENFLSSGNMRLDQQLKFSAEIDKMTNVYRRTLLVSGERRENDAEHSWHVAVMALLFKEYCVEEPNVERAIKMLVVHDLIEIYAGDTFAYDVKGNESKAEREAAAADKLYSQLPPEQGSELKALWEEFDGMETVDAKYAACLDRIQPLLHNTLTEGHTWQNNGAVRSQVEARAGIVKEFMPEVYAWIDKNLDRGVELGWIKDI
ncbi:MULTISPECIES: HD domain-containing protein [Eubacterium]|jgi:putative hydrolase of HD superfamily|uniref:Putative hydrolases of HD superfamily n=1 Tax=Eubacterium ruminantium TaxID=42322 RepID=A0A1T4PA03_9FIRM|nr:MULTISPECIES: HD domain-containing protein [Eubacterium]MCR5368777.1 HD domain-containing protein [Eubacterium sp.]SCW58621.1 putative hydrolases of HD superfamily [Eubacterium ruminantium]SDM98236.1 putative hydrolases of HD superfamily [Eubacterium ruminantium]SJZ88354.1 putative hydrolases of HD superfamily [Eubacterium ruminantium]